MKTNTTNGLNNVNGEQRIDSNVTNMSMEEQASLLTKLLAEKTKAKERSKKYREENKAKCDMWSLRARVRSTLLCAKAKESGLTIEEREIDEYIANMK